MLFKKRTIELKYSRRLLTDAQTSKNIRKIKRHFRKDDFNPGIYVVVMNEDKKRPECLSSELLCQTYYRKHIPYIIGISASEAGARNILCYIVDRTFYKFGAESYDSFISEFLEEFPSDDKVTCIIVPTVGNDDDESEHANPFDILKISKGGHK